MTASAQTSDLDPATFRAIADLAYRESGLILVEEKSSMVRSRLRHRLRDLGLDDFAAYGALLTSDAGKTERRHLISALTTNVSHFFREDHHFTLLGEELKDRLPALRAGGKLRLWSAGCSNGQEAVSAAITILEKCPDVSRLDVRILATDIDPEVVDFARRGIYPERLMGGVPADLREKYFKISGMEGGEQSFAINPEVRELISYRELNLLGNWPMKKLFDFIFCRNVVIYFDVETQERLWPRMRKALSGTGALFLGHSERMTDPDRFGFTCTGPTIYRPTTA